MNDDEVQNQNQKQNKANGFGIKTNTIITGLFGLLLTLLSVVNHMQTQSSHDDTIAAVKDLKLEVLSTYVNKSDFSAQITALSADNSKLWEKQAALSDTLNQSVGAINLKLQHIEDSLPVKLNNQP